MKDKLRFYFLISGTTDDVSNRISKQPVREHTVREKFIAFFYVALFLFFFSVLQLSSSVDSNSFFGPGEFKKADTRR